MAVFVFIYMSYLFKNINELSCILHIINYYLCEYIYYISHKKQKITLFWLILPVVICLSQRLSHACLSTHELKVKPQKAHYISYGSLDR